ncbi:hypothetical protein J2Z32_003761 [Paenibacillus turicensis]|uniref:Holin n=1 Tax=Paenibacillus turicensis TaxID=160487 RepID=A0ABS4FWY5_9BACL|nr:hypothetical protein [Paenibacillus turicensis]MBP1907096.1 hypothetical protein [Paenibacillus turicensis]
MQWALEHPWLAFILGVMLALILSDAVTNYFRYKFAKLAQKDVDKHK